MKNDYTIFGYALARPAWVLTISILLFSQMATAQSCPSTTTTNINSYPNTYYPASQASVPAGSTSIVLGSAYYGSTPISTGDILLIIQMQGAQINSSNNINYGDGSGDGSGYLSNARADGRKYGICDCSQQPRHGRWYADDFFRVGQQLSEYTFRYRRTVYLPGDPRSDLL
ncbi:hypothetical protein ACQ86N_44580 [Puia sp. P3]|uniref:hypothetical protein n=1 Tax=Puia sp. P3 TaxID=3423952 RepID=UPI003D672AEE